MEFKKEFIEKLGKAKSLLFFTGAGISAESGIPTFRGDEGLWKKFKPEELANFNAFMRNPDMVWEWYQYRRKIINNSEPNAGHLAIKELENYYTVNVVTQNVDNLHRRADSKNVFELHGNIERNYCIDCKTYYNEEIKFEDKVPKCNNCGGMIRPDVVWFGENLPQDIFNDAENKAKETDICFIVGTTAIVFPAAYIPVIAKEHGAYLVEINIQPTEISNQVDYSITGKAGMVLPEILNLVKNK